MNSRIVKVRTLMGFDSHGVPKDGRAPAALRRGWQNVPVPKQILKHNGTKPATSSTLTRYIM